MPQPPEIQATKFPAALAVRALRLTVGCDRPASAVPAAPAPAKAIPA